jgi:23S rRNA (pseudouridine1915-N3)-methyltransferase
VDGRSLFGAAGRARLSAVEVALAAIGRLKAGPESELCARYLDRARKTGRKLGLKGFTVSETPESRAARAGERLAQEEQALLATIGRGQCVCLDAAGELIDSNAFAQMLGDGAAAALQRTTFVIGGADGLGNHILGFANRRLAFGRVTWPHQLVRILLAEQLYRAVTLLSGHPYHRA